MHFENVNLHVPLLVFLLNNTAKPKNVSPTKHDLEEDDDADDYEEVRVTIPTSIVKPSQRVLPDPRVQKHVSVAPLPGISMEMFLECILDHWSL
jgi:hypothetical protein